MKILGINTKSDVPEIKLGIVGTSSAGKTYLLKAIQKFTLDMYLKSGLEFALQTGQDTTNIYSELTAAIDTISSNVLASTMNANDFNFSLFDGEKRIVDLIYHDAVGQLIDKIGNPDSEKNRERFVNTIINSNVMKSISK
jgi:GTPase SAR1 family protein